MKKHAKLLISLFLSILLSMGAFAQMGTYRGRLSPEDQKNFDHYYRQWVEALQSNNRTQAADAEKHMQDVMGSNAIPTSVPYDAIATSNAWSEYKQYRSRLSLTDQSEFDSEYQQWTNYKRLDSREDILRMEARMRQIMEHYGIPSSVPFAALTRPSTGVYGSGRINAWEGRLTLPDQHTFDDAYGQWLEACLANDHKAIIGQVLVMQNMMRQYNVPLTVSFDQLASPSVAQSAYSDLEILKASYGGKGHVTDVHAHLQHLVRNNKLNLVVNDDTMGAPSAASHKTLTVEYSVRGSKHEVTVPEGGKLNIP
jgi:hypothetical protein